MSIDGTQHLDLVVMITLAAAITAALIAREVQRNRRARAVLIGDGYEVDLAPPWLVAHRQNRANAAAAKSRPQGVWSAWYREGTLGAYVCTYVSVMARATGRTLPISGARLEIVDDPDAGHVVLAARDVPLGENAVAHSLSSIEIDASISITSSVPSRKAMLVLFLDLGDRNVERRLCRVEHRFATAGATRKDREVESV